MMQINFLRERRRKLTKQQLLDKKLFQIGLVVCGVAVVLMIGSVVVRLSIAYLLNQETQTQNQLMASIKQQEANERTYLIFTAKLKTLAELLAKRQDKQQAILYFSTIFGQGVVVSNVTYEGDEAKLTFGLKAADIFTAERVIALLKSPELQDQFANVAIQSLQRNQNGEYTTQVEITLANEGEASEPEI